MRRLPSSKSVGRVESLGARGCNENTAARKKKEKGVSTTHARPLPPQRVNTTNTFANTGTPQERGCAGSPRPEKQNRENPPQPRTDEVEDAHARRRRRWLARWVCVRMRCVFRRRPTSHCTRVACVCPCMYVCTRTVHTFESRHAASLCRGGPATAACPLATVIALYSRASRRRNKPRRKCRAGASAEAVSVL